MKYSWIESSFAREQKSCQKCVIILSAVPQFTSRSIEKLPDFNARMSFATLNALPSHWVAKVDAASDGSRLIPVRQVTEVDRDVRPGRLVERQRGNFWKRAVSDTP